MQDRAGTTQTLTAPAGFTGWHEALWCNMGDMLHGHDSGAQARHERNASALGFRGAGLCFRAVRNALKGAARQHAGKGGRGYGPNAGRSGRGVSRGAGLFFLTPKNSGEITRHGAPVPGYSINSERQTHG